MGLHSPFDALFRTENFPVTSQPLCQVSASPMLSPVDWDLPAVIHGPEANPDFTLFPICIFSKDSRVFLTVSENMWCKPEGGRYCPEIWDQQKYKLGKLETVARAFD